jgi:hypothetical protein
MSAVWTTNGNPARSLSAAITPDMSQSGHLMRGTQSLFSIRQRPREALYDLAERCKQGDWDGEGADAISPGTYQRAYAFLDALPIDLPDPCFIPEPDGQIAMEWYAGAGRLAVVSIGEDGKLLYSFDLGGKRGSGNEFFAGDIPESILGLIQSATYR